MGIISFYLNQIYHVVIIMGRQRQKT